VALINLAGRIDPTALLRGLIRARTRGSGLERVTRFGLPVEEPIPRGVRWLCFPRGCSPIEERAETYK
jgi:hypothetical protein